MQKRMHAPSARVWSEMGFVAFAALFIAGGCDWFNGPTEANVPPETTIVSCPGAGDVTAGDDVTVEWSGSDPDGSVTAYRWILDDGAPEQTTSTSVVLDDVAEGEHTFTVAAVDDDGDVDPSPAVCTFTAGPAGALVGRVVLCELLTTKFCANCWKAELALDRMLGQYGRDELTVVAYHYDDDVNIPPDPVATDESNARCDWYYEHSDVGEHYALFPLTIFDGGRFVVGADDTTATKSAYSFEIDLRRAVGSPVSVSLAGDISGGRGDVTVTVRVRDALSGGPHVLRAVVVEDGIVDGSHRFDFVARDLLEDEELAVSVVGDSAVVHRTFAVDPGWNVGKLDVIAFVQNDSTTEILQSGRLMTE